MSNPFKSRKFLLLLLDTAIAIITLLATNHLAPELIEEVLALIAILQPVFVVVINAIAKENVAAMAAGIYKK